MWAWFQPDLSGKKRFKEINLADRAPRLVGVESRRSPVTRATISFPQSIKVLLS